MGTGKGKAQLFAVEKQGVEDEVLKLYRERVPATKISLELKKKGVDITPLGINRWLKAQREKDKEHVDLVSREKFEAMVVDYKNEIKTILDEVKEMKNDAKQEKDIQAYDKMVGRLYQGMELLAKLMGDMKPSNQVNIVNIINEVNRQAVKDNKNLRSMIHGKIIDVETDIVEEMESEK